MPNRKLPNDAELAALYQTTPTGEIQARYGVTRQAVYWRLKKMGIKQGRWRVAGVNRWRLKLEGVACPHQLNQENQTTSLTAIGRQYGVSSAAVANFLRAHGYEPKVSQWPNYRADLDAWDLWKMNQTTPMTKMTEALGCSANTIRRRLESIGKEPVKWYGGRKPR